MKVKDYLKNRPKMKMVTVELNTDILLSKVRQILNNNNMKKEIRIIDKKLKTCYCIDDIYCLVEEFVEIV